ncbi:uncharacterized protein BDZ99DRAFT_471943 [Mytilinidion resinicola]|uniref:Uncharacterized protein n=1 Tax=Mytilinidion resinicola TaxID=574789 RepID=A0A6A6Z021_9PEZI|nr:uncharacterized protein BDZ99DRAFT_471943 [Mytilinidion resinicola]KAF2814526.1 hypothetical protein BDZ99DRAFT_471943 [Mytilinidion resinicola]
MEDEEEEICASWMEDEEEEICVNWMEDEEEDICAHVPLSSDVTRRSSPGPVGSVATVLRYGSETIGLDDAEEDGLEADKSGSHTSADDAADVEAASTATATGTRNTEHAADHPLAELRELVAQLHDSVRTEIDTGAALQARITQVEDAEYMMRLLMHNSSQVLEERNDFANDAIRMKSETEKLMRQFRELRDEKRKLGEQVEFGKRIEELEMEDRRLKDRFREIAGEGEVLRRRGRGEHELGRESLNRGEEGKMRSLGKSGGKGEQAVVGARWRKAGGYVRHATSWLFSSGSVSRR